jgi:hypothetical protein
MERPVSVARPSNIMNAAPSLSGFAEGMPSITIAIETIRLSNDKNNGTRILSGTGFTASKSG